ncbi:MAG: outer membrane beta-barrel protein [Gammaproteobacteria bacterium]|nr:outer membrane beta-barrel protein [Gammaproteobacteria bacterium]
MKLFPSVLSLGLLLAATSACAFSSGAYVSFGGGANFTNMDSTWSSGGTSTPPLPPGPLPPLFNRAALGAVIPTALNFSSGHDSALTRPEFNFAAGYGWIFNNYYVATQLDYTSNSKTSTSTDNNAGTGTVTNGFPPVISTVRYTYSNQAELTDQFSAGLKLGQMLTPNNMVYIHPALAYAKINTSQQLSSSMNVLPLSTTTKSLWGAEMGLGYEHLFTPALSAAVEADYIRYQTYSIINTTDGITTPVTTTYKPDQYRLNVSLIYHF